MKKLGLIGVGKMGLSHLAIANTLDGAEVVAICDTSKILLNVLSKGVKAKAFSDFNHMINSCNLDGVIISVPNSFHFNVVKACLSKGINTFIEKPLTLNASQSKELLDLAVAKNLTLQVGYVNRFCDSFIFVRKLLNEGIFGNVINYKSQMNGPVIIDEHNNGWRNDYTKGGGCLNDYGPHCIDLVCYLFGIDFNVKAANLESLYSTNVDDIAKINIEHKNGTTGYLEINWSDSSVRKATNIVEIELEFANIKVSKQEVFISSKVEVPVLGVVKGENKKNITDFNTDVSYYLRGEEFSRQLHYFFQAINGIQGDICCPKSAVKVDETIKDVFKITGVVNG